MARELGNSVPPAPGTGGDTNGSRSPARSTARAFAAAISALFISTLVIDRSSEALETDGAVSATAVESGILAIEDDDAGRSLFDLSDMAPGRAEERCIEIRYTGTILPVELTLVAETVGDLGPFLEATIESGIGGGFGSCEQFERAESVYSGSLADLVDRGPLALGPILTRDDRRSFRITFELADTQDALGKVASLDLVWEVSP
jgi:hypothetical protein